MTTDFKDLRKNSITAKSISFMNMNDFFAISNKGFEIGIS